MHEHHSTSGADEQLPRSSWPPAGTWPGPASDPDPDDPYGYDTPGPDWRIAPQRQDQPGSFTDQAAGWEPAAGSPASRPRTWPAMPARRGARPRTWRPAVMLAALVLLGAAFGAGIAAISSEQTIRFTPADNPVASQYTPSAGPVTQSSATASTSPGTASPSPAGTASPSPAPASYPPAISQAAAAKVLAGFWTQNNRADMERSTALLAGIEAGTSYAIDAGAYQAGRAEDPDGSRYTAIVPASGSTVYWIPRLASGMYPRWFAVRVAYVRASEPQHDIVTGYLIFAQASAGAAWKDGLEQYLLHATTDPFILTGADGYATAVPPGAAGLAVQPGQVPAQAAASLDGAASLVQDPGHLADLRDLAYFAAHLPAGSSAADTHVPGGTVYALGTVGGGAVVFYDLTAQIAIAAPPGQQVAIGIPGYFSPGQPVSSAAISYADQFAVYVPPAGQGSPQLLADASGITG